MNEQLVLFEGQEEIKVKTDQGETLINLASSATVCGITKLANSGNEVIKWKDGRNGVYGKLEKLRGNIVGTDSEQKYTEEIDYILDEIENTGDRNTIYMSRYLTSRLAMECHNDKANKYKDFLAKLDESYSNGELKISSQQLTNLVSTTMNNILPTMIESITKQFNPILSETRKQVEESRQQVKDISEKLGLRNRNTQIIGKKLIHKECDFYGRRIYGSHLEHRLNKSKIFNHFNVLSLDDISVTKFDEVITYVDNMELIPKEIIEKM